MKHRARFDHRGLLAMRADAWNLFFQVEEKTSCEPFETRGEVAIVSVEGPLTHHADWWWDSYDSIKERVTAALESPAKTVVMRIDSPGGLVSGCYETARYLRDAAKSKGKKLVAYADGMAASAGYALASAASEIYLPETGVVGSIGVINTLFDCVELDRKQGLNFTVIASGERKKYGHPSVPTSEAAIASAQREVNFLAALFFELVAESRPQLDVEAIAALEAGVLYGKQAVDAKLADAVCTFDSLLERLSSDPSSNAAADAGADNEDENMGWKDALKKAADEGDEEAKKALQALDGDGEEDKDDDKESKAEGDDGDDKESKAEGSDDGAGDEQKDEDKESKAAAAATGTGLSLAASVQSLMAWKAEREEREERAALMASRPDLAKEVVAFLERQPVAVVRDAVKTLPRGAAASKGGQVGAARAALGIAPKESVPPTGTGAETLPAKEHAEILGGMGIRAEASSEESVKVLEGGFTQFKFRPSSAAKTTAAPAVEKGSK
jgi:signal peptide peptidase SppA